MSMPPTSAPCIEFEYSTLLYSRLLPRFAANVDAGDMRSVYELLVVRDRYDFASFLSAPLYLLPMYCTRLQQ
jgi:hypothetical protein